MIDRRILAMIAAAVFGLGFMAGTCGKATTAELEAAHDSTTAAVDRAHEAERNRLAIESSARADSFRFAAARATAEDAARTGASRRPTIIERVVERSGPDSAIVRAAIVEVLDSVEVHELRPLRRALVLSDSLYASRGRLLASTDEARLRANDALAAAVAETRALRDARPSWVRRNAEKLGWAAVGYAVGRYGPSVVKAVGG